MNPTVDFADAPIGGISLDFTTPRKTKTYTRWFNFYRDGSVSGGYNTEGDAQHGVLVRSRAACYPITFTVEE